MNVQLVSSFFAGFLTLVAANVYAGELPSFSECKINDVSNSPSTIAYDSDHEEALVEASTRSYHFRDEECFKWNDAATCTGKLDGNEYSLVMKMETVLGKIRYYVRLDYRTVPQNTYYPVIRPQYCRF